MAGVGLRRTCEKAIDDFHPHFNKQREFGFQNKKSYEKNGLFFVEIKGKM